MLWALVSFWLIGAETIAWFPSHEECLVAQAYLSPPEGEVWLCLPARGE